MNPINVLMATGAITKTDTLATTFHNTMGEVNPYVRFGYGPQTICNQTQVKVSISINADPIDMIQLEEDFISSNLKPQRRIID